MLCILKLAGNDVAGWIIATDCHDARRKADSVGLSALAAELYRMELTPPPGKYPLACGYLMLVS